MSGAESFNPTPDPETTDELLSQDTVEFTGEWPRTRHELFHMTGFFDENGSAPDGSDWKAFI